VENTGMPKPKNKLWQNGLVFKINGQPLQMVEVEP